jgi:hypothetical protein
MLQLKDLLTPNTEEQILNTTIELLDSVGFDASSWQSGSIARTLVQVFARVYSDMTVSVAEVAKGGFNKTATGLWMDLVSESFYENERGGSNATRGFIRLTSLATAPTYTPAASDIIIADSEDAQDETQTYRNIAGFTINPGETIDVEFEAEKPGDAGNIANNTELFFWTPLVGVTATNPPYLTGSSWITEFGADFETDDTLRQRNTGKLSTLAYSTTEGAYRYWVLQAIPGLVTRLTVRESLVTPGQVDVLCATSTGTITGGQAATIQDYLMGTDGTGRRPLNDIPNVQPATLGTLSWFVVATVQGAFTDGVEDLIYDTVNDYLGELPIGGVFLPAASTGVVVLSELIARVRALPGIIDVQFFDADPSLGSPALNANIALDIDKVYTATLTTTVVEVI